MGGGFAGLTAPRDLSPAQSGKSPSIYAGRYHRGTTDLAKETTTHMTDDLDGSEAVEEVTFALRGVEYEVDLSSKNVAALDKLFEKYIKNARPVRHPRSPRGQAKGRGKARSNGAADKGDVAAIRAWASEAGHAVSARGRISGTVRDAYHAAQGWF